MRGLQREIEALAIRLRALGGFADHEPLDASLLAPRLLGTPVLLVPDLEVRACLALLKDGRRQVWVRRVYAETNFEIAHELGHYALMYLARYNDGDDENLANRIAASLLAPPKLVRAARTLYGRQLQPIGPLAEAAMISQTSAQLRLGEVLEDDRVIVTRTNRVLVRASGQLHRASGALVKLARDDAPIRGLAKAVLRGGIDDGRIALRMR